MHSSNLLKVLAVALLLGAGCRTPPDDPTQRLESAASDIARFLTGKERFDALALADSIDLHIAPEGGGGHARISRERLRDPKEWRVDSAGKSHTFVPRGLRTRLVADVGHYMNCRPSMLSTRFPRLAAMPHVGIRLEPPRVRSCLETWNATFVFDTTGGVPRLVAAIYDQWEW
ncbi:MAG: hypothetical protein ABIR92_09525 [Gemmatimonadaceae bacterium]